VSKGEAVKQYKSQPKIKKVSTFELDDRTIEFTAPKMSGLLLDIASGGETGSIAAVLNWLSDGLSEEDNDYIIERLRDPDDDLDFDIIQQIVEDLMEQVTDRPTKRRPGSSR
jgi:hypothetical protein